MDTQTRGWKPHEYRKVMEDAEEVSACTHIASTGGAPGPLGTEHRLGAGQRSWFLKSGLFWGAHFQGPEWEEVGPL